MCCCSLNYWCFPALQIGYPKRMGYFFLGHIQLVQDGTKFLPGSCKVEFCVICILQVGNSIQNATVKKILKQDKITT